MLSENGFVLALSLNIYIFNLFFLFYQTRYHCFRDVHANVQVIFTSFYTVWELNQKYFCNNFLLNLRRKSHGKESEAFPEKLKGKDELCIFILML